MKERIVKAALVGNLKSGKSSFTTRVIDNQYTDQYNKTIGINFAVPRINLNNELIKLQLWDTAGDERFASSRKMYLRGTDFVIVCCDKTDSELVTTLKYHTDMIRETKPSVPIFILLTKADLSNNAEPAQLAGNFAAGKENCHYLGEISAKENTQAEIQFFLKEAILTIDLNTKNLKNIFFQKYAELRKEQWKPSLFGLLTRTHITEDSSWEELIDNARHKEGSVTNQAFLALEWLDKQGEVTALAPHDMKTAAENIACRGMKKLV